MDVNRIIRKLDDRAPSILGSNTFHKFAVLLPMIEKEDGIHILFEVRALNMRRQPGEICFPGGKIDPEDPNEQFTAIRETSEELGIPKNSIIHVKPLDYLVTAFGSIIYPFFGVIENSNEITPNESEVAEIFTVPLSYFREVNPEIFKVHFAPMPESSFPFELIIGGENYNWQTRHVDEYFYKYEDKVIWGMTARILSNFLELIN